MSLAALIFDVDGTLADTEEVHRVAFNLAFDRCGLDWSWSRTQYRRLLQVAGGKERIASYIASLSVSVAESTRLLDLVPRIHAEKTKFYTSVIRDGCVPLRDGVERLLDEALSAGCRLAIATTTTATNVTALLHAALGKRGREMFSVIACGDQVPVKKPAPDIFRFALRHLDLAAEHAVAFEDSVNGLQAARAAGLRTVVTPTYWTQDGDFSSAQLVLPSLGDPHRPLIGEPGGKLCSAAWLTLAELQQMAAAPRVLPSVDAFRAEVRG